MSNWNIDLSYFDKLFLKIVIFLVILIAYLPLALILFKNYLILEKTQNYSQSNYLNKISIHALKY